MAVVRQTVCSVLYSQGFKQLFDLQAIVVPELCRILHHIARGESIAQRGHVAAPALTAKLHDSGHFRKSVV